MTELASQLPWLYSHTVPCGVTTIAETVIDTTVIKCIAIVVGQTEQPLQYLFRINKFDAL